MSDGDDDDRYSSRPIGIHNRSSVTHRPKLPVRNPSAVTGNYHDDDDVGEEDDDSQQHRELQQNRRIDDDDDDDEKPRGEYEQRLGKQNYEFAPRAKRTPQPLPSVRPPMLVDWTEAATHALLDAWGERFVQLGRKSLRSDEWLEVADKVAVAAKVRVSDAQCRNRIDTLKKKYKKEKSKLAESGGGATSRWVYFNRMDSLMDSTPIPTPALPPASSRQPLACGLDSGQYVFTKSRVFKDQANGLVKIGDSSESESENDDAEDSDPPPPQSKKARLLASTARAEEGEDDSASLFSMLAESIHRFGEIYQRIEISKRQQMIELEKMRMEFQKELEVQRRQIFERARSEIARIQKGDQDFNGSVTNPSG